MARRWLLFGFALGFLYAPNPARAQEAVAPSPASEEETESAEYSAAIDSALMEFQARRWAEARAHFRRAHALSPNARTLRGIGMASYEMADYAAAYEALEAALDSTTRPLTDEQRTQVLTLRDRTLALVGRFTLTPCDGARLLVDDVPTVPSGGWPETSGMLLLTLGSHRVLMRRARGTDTVSAATRMDVVGGEAGVALELACPDRTQAGAPASQESAGATPWIVAGVGGAVLVGGIVMTALGLADVAAVENGNGREWSELRAANDRAPILTGVGLPLLVLGAGATLTGLVWGLVDLSSAGARTTAQLRITPMSLALSGSFE